ncbi:PLP-dependent aminotransferase family protein [Bosea sp. F3-2]|uniref:MocR-like pyridoxine biosynthesis transcription factor PdxR n=1 Tax=Bosea sp. F3-2 TaxID=2599640 RepID=UPI0011F06CDB|nr:PLP-dependent aminotransferase family protein [Bosea sp. F3-2]QEL22903.1 PLP-dependent aminotransferase family protein [Bosea sp. F3-2]
MAITPQTKTKAHCSRAQISLLTGINVDQNDAVPLYRRIYNELKRLIFEGKLSPGVMLSSPRVLANQLECSRHTVATAYDYLVYEGVLRSEHGVGTFVAESAAEVAALSLPDPARETATFSMPPLSRFGQRLNEENSQDETDPLKIFGASDSTLFPFELWSRIHSRVWGRGRRRPDTSLLIQGHPDLRHAICRLVHRTRGIQASPEQVLITCGTTQSLDLLLRVLLDPGDKLMVENPGRPKAARLARAQGIQLIPVDVDAAGLNVANGIEIASDARAVLVTASHHYPTGATLSLERRLELLSWASRTGGWIFEDDYDGELIAAARPILPLFSLSENNRIVYMGTFSKSVGSHLRVAYIIAHPKVISALGSARYYIDYFPALLPQPVLAAFIEEGHLEAHIQRMRKIYSERQDLARKEITRQAHDAFELSLGAPSLFLPAWLSATEPLNDKDVARFARSADIPAFDISSMYLTPRPRQGIVLGTGRMSSAAIPQRIGRFVGILNSSRAVHQEI